MKKCPRCQVVYYSNRRVTCLYCDSRLQSAEVDEFFRVRDESVLKTAPSFFSEPMDLGRMQYILGGYFKIRSFTFFYTFCRNQMKMGKEFKRFLIEPMGLWYIIRLPWVVINIVDSILFHLMYRGYCPECQWKKNVLMGKHTREQCSYNKEYSAVLKDILSGEIVKTEEAFERRALQKVRLGYRSSYYDLCSQRKHFELFTDVVVILFSIGLFLYYLVKAGMGWMNKIYYF